MKFFLVSCIQFIILSQVFAQTVVYPQDRLYENLESWETAGVISELPNMKPFSVKTVVDALNQVIANGLVPESQRSLAKYYLDLMNRIHPEFDSKYRTDFENNFVQAGTRFWGQGIVADWLDLGVDARQWLLYDRDGLIAPNHTAIEEDFIVDNTNLGTGEATLNFRQFIAAQVDIHFLPELSLHMGIGRNSIGPFWFNGVVMGPQAPASGAFTLNFNTEGIRFDMGFYPIIATDNEGLHGISGKYLYYHGLYIDIVKELEFSIFESVVSGRGEPLYLLPVANYFYAQGLGGFADNSLAGIGLKFTPVNGLKLATVLYMDDMHFNDVIRFQFDTKYKFAFEIGGTWTPYALGDIPWFESLRLDYTAVMPYMYTHYDFDSTLSDHNFSNYTNQGKNIGPDLDPNSDRVNLAATLAPSEDVRITLGLQYIRHGNASKGVFDHPFLNEDGSIFDPGYDNNKATFEPEYNDPTGQPHTRFLTQEVLEYLYKVKLDAEFNLLKLNLDPNFPSYLAVLKASLGYELQVLQNENFVAGKTNINNILSAMIGFSL